jgi:hypothetical protein
MRFGWLATVQLGVLPQQYKDRAVYFLVEFGIRVNRVVDKIITDMDPDRPGCFFGKASMMF